MKGAAVWQLAPADQPPADFPDSIIFRSFYNRPQVELAFEHIIRSYGQGSRPPRLKLKDNKEKEKRGKGMARGYQVA